MKPLVIYHDHCTDGFGAAFAAWCKLGDSAAYLPMSYGQDFTEDPRNRDVYILDFSFAKDTTELILDYANKLVWLDHHKTAFEMWAGGHTDLFTQKHHTFQGETKDCHIYLDQHRSGAMLAWEYFHPDKEVPALISYIDDRDRWVFKYGSASKALHAGLQTMQPWKFEDWTHLLSYDGLQDTCAAGYTTLNIYDKQIADRVKVAEKCCVTLQCWNEDEVPGFTRSDGYDRLYDGLAVNSPIHQSEIGNELAKASGTYGLVWYYDSATKRANVSLRSIGDYDVSAIAKTFGGGGHRNAAGFNIDISTLLGLLR